MIGAANGVPPASAHRIGAPVQDACADGATEEITADHVIGATGSRVDLGKLGFMDADIRSAIRLCDTSPAWSRQFESSVKGLYFVGVVGANGFGAVSRFAFGANFTAVRLTRHLARTATVAVPVRQTIAA